MNIVKNIVIDNVEEDKLNVWVEGDHDNVVHGDKENEGGESLGGQVRDLKLFILCNSYWDGRKTSAESGRHRAQPVTPRRQRLLLHLHPWQHRRGQRVWQPCQQPRTQNKLRFLQGETEEEKRPKLNCEQTEPSQCQSPEKEKCDNLFAKPNKAKKKHHKERKLKKEEKEEKKAKGKSEKSKAKKKKRKEAAKKSKTESNGGQSTAMETDETSNPAALTDAKAADITEPQNLAPKPQAQLSNNPQHVAPNFQQPQIPTNFNFGQPQFPAAPPTLAPAGSAPWSAQWSGLSPADMAMEQARHQEAVQAQAMSRRRLYEGNF